MSLLHIAYRSIVQRGVASLLTMLSMALGVMLVVAVLSIHGVVSRSFKNNSSLGYSMIIGAKGGKEQLTLNTVYYLSSPVENISYDYYLEFLGQKEREKLLIPSLRHKAREALRAAGELRAQSGLSAAEALASEAAISALAEQLAKASNLNREGQYSLLVEKAYPLCLGDYYGRFRAVGATPAMFDELEWNINDQIHKFEFAAGRNFVEKSPEHGYFEAIVGAQVAREIRLTELHLKLDKKHLDAALRLLREKINWSRLEEREGRLVLTLGQGTTESDLLLTLERLMENEAKGRVTLTDDEKQALAALQAPAAVVQRTSRPLEVGDAISPAHGEPGGHTHARKFTIVGILAPNGTPNDRAVFINMEGFYLMEDHAKPVEEAAPPADEPPLDDAAAKAKFLAARQKKARVELDPNPDPLPVEQREVTAVLIKTSAMAAIGLENAVQEGKDAQAVLPVGVITGMFEFFVNPIRAVLLALTAMICIVSGISILVSIYNSMSERRHEIAVMRALGAGRGAVMAIILLEATLLALGGGIIGWLLGHLGGLLASPFIEEKTGVAIGFNLWSEPFVHPLQLLGLDSPAATWFSIPLELALVPALVALAILVGLWPAISAYRTDVAKSLGK